MCPLPALNFVPRKLDSWRGRIKQSSGAICAVKWKSDLVHPVCVCCHWQWEVTSIYMTTSCGEHLRGETNMATSGRVEMGKRGIDAGMTGLWENLEKDAGWKEIRTNYPEGRRAGWRGKTLLAVGWCSWREAGQVLWTSLDVGVWAWPCASRFKDFSEWDFKNELLTWHPPGSRVRGGVPDSKYSSVLGVLVLGIYEKALQATQQIWHTAGGMAFKGQHPGQVRDKKIPDVKWEKWWRQAIFITMFPFKNS